MDFLKIPKQQGASRQTKFWVKISVNSRSCAFFSSSSAPCVRTLSFSLTGGENCELASDEVSIGMGGVENPKGSFSIQN